MNKKIKNIILKSILLLIVGCFLFLVITANIKREKAFNSKAPIKINHLANNYFIDEQTFVKLINKKYPASHKPGSQDLKNVEQYLRGMPQVRDVQAFIDNSGKLNVSIRQRQPILRVITQTGHNFYVDNMGMKFPTSTLYTAKVPILTGLKDEKGGSAGKVHSAELKKVLNVTAFVREDKFLDALVAQYNLSQKGEIEILPRMGNFVVEIGDDKELKSKFKNLRIFYFEGLKNIGWDTYKTINVKFKNQVVCSKT